MQRVLLPVRGDHGVAGVVAALVAHDVVDLLAEQVGNLALALVAPLGADEHDRWHLSPPLRGACTRQMSAGQPPVVRLTSQMDRRTW